MAQPINSRPTVRPGYGAPAAKPLSGPILPGEYRPVAPVPASSESSDPPIATEPVLLAQLIKHYRWTFIGPDQMMRYNPHRRNIQAEVAEVVNG